MDYWDKFTQDWMEHEEKIDFCQQNLNLLSSEDLATLYKKLLCQQHLKVLKYKKLLYQQHLKVLNLEDLDALYDKLKKLHPSSNFNTN